LATGRHCGLEPGCRVFAGRCWATFTTAGARGSRLSVLLYPSRCGALLIISAEREYHGAARSRIRAMPSPELLATGCRHAASARAFAMASRCLKGAGTAALCLLYLYLSAAPRRLWLHIQLTFGGIIHQQRSPHIIKRKSDGSIVAVCGAGAGRRRTRVRHLRQSLRAGAGCKNDLSMRAGLPEARLPG